ncbi:hypothetical protein EI94DRAFT_1708945 [Lactarius quietus]|nr:hypothetical protein EI94DRAFT_1708945 [Lactarius quietus]
MWDLFTSLDGAHQLFKFLECATAAHKPSRAPWLPGVPRLDPTTNGWYWDDTPFSSRRFDAVISAVTAVLLLSPMFDCTTPRTARSHCPLPATSPNHSCVNKRGAKTRSDKENYGVRLELGGCPVTPCMRDVALAPQCNSVCAAGILAVVYLRSSVCFWISQVAKQAKANWPECGRYNSGEWEEKRRIAILLPYFSERRAR